MNINSVSSLAIPCGPRRNVMNRKELGLMVPLLGALVFNSTQKKKRSEAY